MAGERFKPQSRMQRELPQEILGQVNAMMTDGATYEEVSQWLTDNGYDISRAAVGRYGKKFFEFRQKVVRFRDQADILQADPGDALKIDGVLSQALMQQVMEKVMTGELDITEAPKLMDSLSRLQSANTNREKFMTTLADRAQKAAQTVSTIARKGGLSGETIGLIRKEILGIAE